MTVLRDVDTEWQEQVMEEQLQAGFLDTETVMQTYRDMVYRIALTHSRNREDAADILQEVFLTYHRRQLTFEDLGRLKGWLIVTTINCARRVTSSNWARRVVPLDSHELAVSDERLQHFRTEEEDELYAALLSLPRIYREVLELFYFEELPVLEIASALSLEVGTVKVQLSRGRALMRTRLSTQTGGLFHD